MKNLPILALLFIIFLSSSVPALASFSDIDGSWAREAITRLDEHGIFDNLYTDKFQPNNTITREELIEIVARAFNLTNTDQQTIYTWLDHLMAHDPASASASANNQLNRAELVAVVAKVLGLTEYGIDPATWTPSFADVPPEHPVFTAVEMINLLDILPTYVLNNFEPTRLSSRAEVAALIDAALNLELVEGQITEIHENSNRLIVKTPENEYRSIPVTTETVILQQGNNLSITNLAAGNKISAIYDRTGNVQLVSVNSAKTGSSLLQAIGNLLNGLKGAQNLEQVQELPVLQELSQVLTPEQMAAIITGDWARVNDSLRYSLYQEFVELGMTPWEAEALLSQDWSSLEDMGIDRLALALSDYAGITPEIIYSALNQDWNQLLEYAQVEVAQRLLTGTIF